MHVLGSQRRCQCFFRFNHLRRRLASGTARWRMRGTMARVGSLALSLCAAQVVLTITGAWWFPIRSEW